MQPKGKLLIIGGAEDMGGREGPDMENLNIKFKRYDILKHLLSASNKSITIITAASRSQGSVKRDYKYAFEKLNYSNLHFISLHKKSECKNRDFIKVLNETGAVFFTGGDQSKLTAILSHTKLLKIIKQRYFFDADFLLAGTSAGAMAIGDIMITEGTTGEALIANKIKLSSGLNIIKQFIIDTHFIKRSRIGRLTHAVLLHPDHLGIGLGEDTALIIKNNVAECRGSGMVIIIDASHIKNTNIHTAIRGEPLYAENLKMHLLVKGTKFSFKRKHIME